METNELLKRKIETEFEKLDEEDLKSSEKDEIINNIVKLIDREIEIKKIENEKKDQLIKNIIAILGITAPLAVTIWGALKSWQFEKTGTVSSLIGQMFMRCFRIKD